MKRIILFIAVILLYSCSKDDENNTNGGTDNNQNNTTANQQVTGSSSRDLLSDDTFTSMVIELVYVEGFKPTQTAINNFISFLEARTFKPNGITVQERAIAPPGNTTYSIQEIVNLEEANRTQYNSGNTIAVWVFFADGASASNSGNNVVLGTAYRNTSFVIFEKTIHDLSNEPLEPNRSVLESTVIHHEFGHILGLTNLGADLQSNHEDAAHPKHCDVNDCLMFWQAETGSGIGGMVSGGQIPQLDAQCIADLQANGGK